jgi:hypothetical protein
MLDTKPKTAGTAASVRFDQDDDMALEDAALLASSMRGVPEGLGRLKALQDSDGYPIKPGKHDMTMRSDGGMYGNIPSVPDSLANTGKSVDFGDTGDHRKRDTFAQMRGDGGGGGRSRESKTAMSDDLGLTKEDFAAASAGDDATIWKAIFSKVRHGKRDETIQLLDSGCPVDLKDAAGNTLLNIAAQNGHKSIIKMCGARRQACTMHVKMCIPYTTGRSHVLRSHVLNWSITCT